MITDFCVSNILLTLERLDVLTATVKDDDCVVEYANELLEKMNVSSELYDKEDTLNFRHSFIYGIGKLLSVYIYEEYKNNSKEFLSNFRKVLIDYKYNNFELNYINSKLFYILQLYL